MAHDEKNPNHDAHDDHIAHTMSVPMLIGVWATLMVFTVLTVVVSQQGLGPQASFTIAMIIATIKAGLVMAVFMHLWWDRKMNVLIFLGSFLFVLLFISMSVTDKSENTPDINRKTADDLAQSGGAK
jgi:cytochrome c oxidase subunit 4